MVVVASGTNDWHAGSLLYTREQWVAESVAFLQQVDLRANSILLFFCCTQFCSDSLSQDLHDSTGSVECLQRLLILYSSCGD